MTSGNTRQALSRSAIISVARRIADTEGIGELTLRRVAAELGTGQASLYRHIQHRAELLALLADELAAEFPIVEPSSSDAPPDAIAAQWLAMFDYLVAHSWGAQVIAGGHHLATGAVPVVGHSQALLRAAGLSETDALHGYRALWHLLLGHLLNAHPLGHHRDTTGNTSDTAVSTPDSSEFEWALRRLTAGLGTMNAWHR